MYVIYYMVTFTINILQIFCIYTIHGSYGYIYLQAKVPIFPPYQGHAKFQSWKVSVQERHTHRIHECMEYLPTLGLF